MLYRLLADAILLFHLFFILFALFGGLFILWRKWIVFVHLPTAVWATLAGFTGWICPLTPLEKSFREASGEMGYSGGFIEHYITPIIYPAALDMDMHLVLGYIALAINLVIYALVIYHYRRRTSNI